MGASSAAAPMRRRWLCACPGARTPGSPARSRRAPASVSRPPDTTAAWVPMIDATTLASALPISGPPVTTRMWIDDTRPRSASGVRICTIELRSTALMTSAPADSARKPSASGKLNVASPNPTIAEAPDRDRDQHGPPRPAHGRRPAAEQRAEHRPEADRRPHQADARRADPEHVEGERREQRAGPPEDHRADVDDEGGQHLTAPPGETQPFRDGREARAGARPARAGSGDISRSATITDANVTTSIA